MTSSGPLCWTMKLRFFFLADVCVSKQQKFNQTKKKETKFFLVENDCTVFKKEKKKSGGSRTNTFGPIRRAGRRVRFSTSRATPLLGVGPIGFRRSLAVHERSLFARWVSTPFRQCLISCPTNCFQIAKPTHTDGESSTTQSISKDLLQSIYWFDLLEFRQSELCTQR